MEKHKYGFTDGSSIVTAGFIVNFYGDESVGIQDGSWTVKPDYAGPFYFDDEEHVETFKEALADAFEIITADRCGVETIEEQGRRLDQEEAALNQQNDSKRGLDGEGKQLISEIKKLMDWAKRECEKHQDGLYVHYGGMIQAYNDVINLINKLKKPKRISENIGDKRI